MPGNWDSTAACRIVRLLPVLDPESRSHARLAVPDVIWDLDDEPNARSRELEAIAEIPGDLLCRMLLALLAARARSLNTYHARRVVTVGHGKDTATLQPDGIKT